MVFKKGNKINLGRHLSEETKQKMSKSLKGHPGAIGLTGKNHPDWKGDNVGYNALHVWVRRHKPCQTNCSMCGEIKPLELANVSGDYKRNITDFIWLCTKCHSKYDRDKRHG